MGRPIVGRDLVMDQVVHGLCIGYTQQRLRQAHQGHALLRRQPVFGKKRLQHLNIGLAAYGAHKIDRPRRDRSTLLSRKVGERDKALHCFGFIGKRIGANFLAYLVERGRMHGSVTH